MQTALDLQDQDIPTPAVFEGGAKIPLSRGTVLDPVQDSDIVAPEQFCSSGQGLGQRTHIAEVPWSDPLNSRELSLQILSEPVDSPTAAVLRSGHVWMNHGDLPWRATKRQGPRLLPPFPHPDSFPNS